MWYVHLDVKHQEFVIENGEGNVIASKALPMQGSTYASADTLLAIPENAKAWKQIWDMLAAANMAQCKDICLGEGYMEDDADLVVISK